MTDKKYVILKEEDGNLGVIGYESVEELKEKFIQALKDEYAYDKVRWISAKGLDDQGRPSNAVAEVQFQWSEGNGSSTGTDTLWLETTWLY